MEYEKLPEDFKRRWVEALRSGEYQQGRFRLRTPEDCYCCLGVACIVAGVDDPRDVEDGSGYISADCEFDVLRPLIASEASKMLSAFNDYGNKTFPEIADWIEANL